MRRTTSNRRCVIVPLMAAVACLSSTLADGKDTLKPDTLARASRIVLSSSASGGICAVVGSDDADLAMAIAKQGPFVVQGLCDDSQLRDAMRKAIRAHGMYGDVSADTFEPGRLPYTENLINIVVVDSYPRLAKAGFSAAEVIRVLAPLGYACVGTSSASAESEEWTEALIDSLKSSGIEDVSLDTSGGTWVRFNKPWPEEIDEWTHYLHGPDGNPVARDTVVGPPEHYQWLSKPTWLRSHETDSSISTMVTSAGKLFYIVDEAPISLAGDHPLPDKWCLACRDAFNGVLLWKVPIRRWGWREWKNSWFTTRPGDVPLNIRDRLVAVDDKVYVTLGYRAPVSQLDARSGEILQTYPGTERTGEILYLDGKLILSLVGEEQDTITVTAVDAASGKQLWLTEKGYQGTTVDYVKWNSRYGSSKPPKLDPASNIATDGRVVALIDGPEIACLDYQSGEERWRSEFPQDEADSSAGGINSQGNLWNGTMIVNRGVVVHASPSRLAAFSAEDGRLLWSQPKKYIGHLWYEWKDVFVIDGLVWTWSAELTESFFDIGGGRRQRELWPPSVNGYDLSTGQLKKEVPLGPIFNANHHHRCYRNKATVRYILASRRGTEFVDLEEGKHTVHNWVRGTCHMGMMPANGFQYAPPHPCQCYIEEKLSGMNALAPARKPESQVQGPKRGLPPRLERGPVFDRIESQSSVSNLQSPDIQSSDWPAFRHDAMRTGSVDTRLPDNLRAAWRVKLGTKVSSPIVVGERLFVSLVDEHQVACVDVTDGGKQWEFTAGGRIDSPPTYHAGTVLFGSADGCVYCLRASDGELAWRFQAAPERRLIGAFGQLESAWPVHGSVLVQKDVAYFAAGRSSQLDGGIHLYGIRVSSGELLHQTKLEGPDYAVGDFEANFKLPLGTLPDVLTCDGTNIYMRSASFDLQLNQQQGKSPLSTPSGFLEDSYFKRVPWTFGGSYARLIAHDARSVYYVRMFDSLRGLDPSVYFTPADKGYLLFAKNVNGGQDTWSERIPVRVRAMVLTDGRLLVAGPPDMVDPEDPLGAFEGRKGGLLYVIDSASGEKLAEHKLPHPPTFNGAAAASGRLYVTEEDGSVTCFAGE